MSAQAQVDAAAAAWTRQFTGEPNVHRAYLVVNGYVIRGCPHRHRHSGTAFRCASRMARTWDKEYQARSAQKDGFR